MSLTPVAVRRIIADRYRGRAPCQPERESFGVAVITPRSLYVLAAAAATRWGDPRIADETLDPLDFDTVAPCAVVGIGIHTGNALRGYELGRELRRRGAWVVFGGSTRRRSRTTQPHTRRSRGGARRR
jgi:hypothetical protein